MLSSIKKLIPWFVITVNYFGGGMLAFLWVNFLYNPQPYLSLNPIFDFLIVRSGGPILYANHVTSCIALLGVTTYFVIKEPKHLAKWCIVIFATASIHEMILDTIFVPLVGYGLFSFRWEFWLSLVLILALWLSNREQKKRLGYIAIVCTIYSAIWVSLVIAFHIDMRTIVIFKPGPAYYDYTENALEVFSWLIPISMWFIPKRLWIK